MGRFTLPAWPARSERRVIGGAALALLALWSFGWLFALDETGVFGRSAIYLLPPLLFLGAFLAMEAARPWLGLCVFLFLWPHLLVVRLLCGAWVNKALESFPECWGGPLAAALAVGLWLGEEYLERGVPSGGPAVLPSGAGQPAVRDPWLEAVRGLLWLAVCAWILSAVAGVARAASHPADWVVQPASWKLRNDPWALTAWRPWCKTVQYLPCLLLGLLLLNRLRDGLERGYADRIRPPFRWLLLCAGAGGLLAALQVLLQIRWDTKWAFDTYPPSGPFTNRNATGPFLVLTGVTVLVALGYGRTWLRWGLLVCAGIAFATVFLTQSRNAILLVLVLPWLALLIRAGRRRLLALAALAALAVAAVLYYPLPQELENDQSTSTARRVLGTVYAIRKGQFFIMGDGRGELFGAAWRIFLRYPFTGAGVGTFPMVAHPSLPLGGAFQGKVIFSPHSMPLEWLCENGPLGALAWCGLWLVLPVLAVARWKKENGWALLPLLVGLANLLDTLWLVPGMATCALVLLALAFHARCAPE